MNILWEDTSREEVMKKINTKSYWVTPDGKIAFSAANNVNDILCKTLTE